MDINTLRTILDQARYIHCHGSEYVPYKNHLYPIEDGAFTRDELAQLDKRLPPVFDHLLSLYATEDDQSISGILVGNILSYWYEPPALELCFDDAFKGPVRLATASLRLMIDDPKETHYHLHADCYEFSKTPCGIEFAEHIIEDVFLIPKKVLDAKYPGWLNRYRVAESLDMSPEERVTHAFGSETPRDTPDIRGIEFE